MYSLAEMEMNNQPIAPQKEERLNKSIPLIVTLGKYSRIREPIMPNEVMDEEYHYSNKGHAQAVDHARNQQRKLRRCKMMTSES